MEELETSWNQSKRLTIFKIQVKPAQKMFPTKVKVLRYLLGQI